MIRVSFPSAPDTRAALAQLVDEHEARKAAGMANDPEWTAEYVRRFDAIGAESEAHCAMLDQMRRTWQADRIAPHLAALETAFYNVNPFALIRPAMWLFIIVVQQNTQHAVTVARTFWTSGGVAGAIRRRRYTRQLRDRDW